MREIILHGDTTGYNTVGGVQVSGGYAHFQFNSQSAGSGVRRPIYSIPYGKNGNLVDRADIFSELEVLLPCTRGSFRAALCGPGGIGKTQIALEFAYRRCEDPICSVFWAQANSLAAFQQSYKAIALKFDPTSKLDGHQLLEFVCARIGSEERWLLIIDNANDLSSFNENATTNLSRYIPAGPTGSVLWTSREDVSQISLSPSQVIKVAKPSLNEAKQLLERSMNKSLSREDQDGVIALLEELQWLPLTIWQSGSFLRTTSTSVREYLTSIRRKRGSQDRKTHFNRGSSFLETWKISVEPLWEHDEVAYAILHVIANFDSQHIPLRLVTEIVKVTRKGIWGNMEEIRDTAIRRLEEFSLISTQTTETGQRFLSLHELVQESARDSLVLEGPETGRRVHMVFSHDSVRSLFQPSTKESIDIDDPRNRDGSYLSYVELQIMAKVFPEPIRQDARNCEQYLAHAIKASQWVRHPEHVPVASCVLHRVYKYTYLNELWEQATAVAEAIYQLLKECYGNIHPLSLDAASQLGTVLKLNDQIGQAQALLEKTLEAQKNVLGPNSLKTTYTAAALAYIYCQQGYEKNEKAYSYRHRVANLRREHLGDVHPDTLCSLLQLAWSHLDRVKYRDSEDIAQHLLRSRVEISGILHPDTIKAMCELSAAYSSHCLFDMAEKLLIRVQRICEQSFGPSHFKTIEAMSYLGVIYRSWGRYEDAQSLHEEASRRFEDTLGPTDSRTLLALGRLALTYQRRGYFEPARGICLEILKRQRKKDKQTPICLTLLADIDYTLGWYEEGKENCLDAVRMQERLHGWGEPLTLTTLNLLRSILTPHEVDLQELPVINITHRRGMIYHDLEALDGIALIKRNLGKNREALKAMDMCCKQSRIYLGPYHPLSIERGDRYATWQREDKDAQPSLLARIGKYLP